MDQADIVIVGAGIIGTTLAWNLRHSGLEVVVVDRAEPGSATTTWTFSWMNASSKARLGYVPEYVALSVEASRHPFELGLDIPGNWLHATGNLELVPAENAAALESDVRRLVKLGYTAQVLDHDQLATRHPELDVDSGTVAAWFPTEGWIDGPALVADIVDRLAGTRVHFRRDEVVGFDCDAGTHRITGVRMGSGDRVSTDRVVLAAGAWTSDLAEHIGVNVPMIPRDEAAVPGLIVRASAPSGGLRQQVIGAGFAVRPHRAGEVLLSGQTRGVEITGDASAETLTDAAEALLAMAAETVPGLRQSRVLGVGVGLRALTADGLSIVGPSATVPNLYVSVTHSGVSLAPLLGKLTARELLTGQPEGDLDRFRLTRFN